MQESKGYDPQTVDNCEICGGPTGLWHLLGGGRLDQCRACGHSRRDLIGCSANHRDEAFGGDPSMDRARIALTYRALVRAGAPSSVFEIGYGSGALLRRFHDAGARIGGVEPDQLGVDVDPVVQEHGTFWTGGIEDVPDGAFEADLVVGIHVIEHVEDPVRTLEKSASLLSPKGRVVMLTPAGDSWGLTNFGSAWWMLEDPTHVRFFTADSLRRVAERAGLTNIRVERLVIDSLSVDVASVARVMRPIRPEGALTGRGVQLAALASAPVVLGLRAVLPRARATLRLTAERAH